MNTLENKSEPSGSPATETIHLPKKKVPEDKLQELAKHFNQNKPFKKDNDAKANL